MDGRGEEPAADGRQGESFQWTSGSQSAEEPQRRRWQQRWVMSNVIIGTPWDEQRLKAQLGSYEKRQAELSHLHVAYYFAEPDMTLIVNRLKGEVTIWRKGRAMR